MSTVLSGLVLCLILSLLYKNDKLPRRVAWSWEQHITGNILTSPKQLLADSLLKTKENKYLIVKEFTNIVLYESAQRLSLEEAK